MTCQRNETPEPLATDALKADETLRQSVKEAIMSYRVKSGRAMTTDDFADAIAPLFYLAREQDGKS